MLAIIIRLGNEAEKIDDHYCEVWRAYNTLLRLGLAVYIILPFLAFSWAALF